MAGETASILFIVQCQTLLHNTASQCKQYNPLNPVLYVSACLTAGLSFGLPLFPHPRSGQPRVSKQAPPKS